MTETELFPYKSARLFNCQNAYTVELITLGYDPAYI